MSETPLEPFTDGIFYEGNIPLGLKFLSTAPSPQEQMHLAHQNCQILQALLSMDPMIYDADDESDLAVHELVRLDNKLNLLLGMVGKLLAQVVQMPASVTACIGAGAMQFELSGGQQESIASHAGESVMLEIFFNPQLLGAVNLIVDLKLKQGAGAVVTAVANYQYMDTKVLELLEKYIFRQHRRAIAQAKKSHSD